MFQEPRRRNEGINLKEKMKVTLIFGFDSDSLKKLHYIPLIESCGSLIKQHSHGTVQSSSVLPWQ